MIFFFFVFWGTGKSILLRQSDWKTSNKFDGSSSNHTSVSAIETALLTKEWAKLLPPPLFTRQKLQTWKQELAFLISSMTWPHYVLFFFGLLIAVMNLSESPSTTTWARQISWAKRMVLRVAKASTRSTELGSWMFWLSTAMIIPSASLTTTPNLLLLNLQRWCRQS